MNKDEYSYKEWIELEENHPDHTDTYRKGNIIFSRFLVFNFEQGIDKVVFKRMTNEELWNRHINRYKVNE